MSQSIAFTLNITPANITDWMTGESGVEFKFRSDVAFRVDGKNEKRATFNAAAMQQITPNATAHPTAAQFTAKIGRGGWLSGTAHYSFRFGGNEVAHLSRASQTSQTQTTDLLTSADVTGSTRASLIQIGAYATSYDAYYFEGSVTLWFNRYDFSASAGTNVSSASVSSATGYDGDTVTYSCAIASGAEFDGWYSGSTKVSSSQTYTHTVNGSDLTLEARAKKQTRQLSVLYGSKKLDGYPVSIEGAVNILYGAQTLATLTDVGRKTLLCAGKYMVSDLVIAGKTLPCAGKTMSDNVTVTVANAELYIVENYVEKISLTGVGRRYSGSVSNVRVPAKSGDTWSMSISSGTSTSGAIHLAEAMPLADYSELHYEIEMKHSNYPNGTYKLYIENWSTEAGSSSSGLYIRDTKEAEQELIAGKNDFVLNSGVLTLPSGTTLNDICLGFYSSYNTISCKIKNLWLT